MSFRVETIDGRPHGAATRWHPSGVVAARGRYRNGKRHGVFEFFDDTGTFLERVAFVEDVSIWRSNDQEQQPPVAVVEAIEAAELEDRRSTLDRRDDRTRYVLPSAAVGVTSVTVGADVSVVPNAVGREALQAQSFLAGEWYGTPHFGAYVVATTPSVSYANTIRRGKAVLEGGGVARWTMQRSAVLLGVGVFGPSGGDDLEGFAVEDAAPFTHVSETVHYLPRVAGARASVSYLRSTGDWEGRVDAGVDYAHNIARDGAVPRIDGDDYWLARAAIAGSLRLERVTAAIELAGGTAMGRDAESPIAVAASLNIPLYRLQLFLAITAPVSETPLVDGVGLAFGVMAYKRK